MRLSGFFSLVAHTGVIAAGLWAAQEPSLNPAPATPMIVIPIELMTIGEVTDIAPVVDTKNMEEQAAAEEAEPVYAAAAPPPPEEDTVNLDAAVTPPKKEEAEKKKVEANPAPAKKKDEDLNSFLDSMLTDVKKDAPKASPAPAGRAATSETAAPRMGAGEMRKTQVTVTDYIRAQLINNRCWTDHSDMADAQRLQTTIRVWFGRDGKFAKPPELREPVREPFNDPPMQVFIQHARTALSKCNTIGWKVPEEYFKLQPAPYYIDIVFVPKVGAQ
jgi:outer membrane biosynthesis protein TonB